MSTVLSASLPFCDARVDAPASAKPVPGVGVLGALRVGIVCNPKSHRNHGAEYEAGVPGADSLIVAAPRTRAALAETLVDFAAHRIDLLVIDGGDGTVRDVLTAAADIWAGSWPRIAVIPSGKTNALAIDLGLPADWTLTDALDAARQGRMIERRPLEIARVGDTAPPARGFLFGAGAFAKATELAQHTHRAGAFNNLAVGLALGWGVAQTLFGTAKSAWRAGTAMRLALPGQPADDAQRYLLLASTLGQLPMGLKPFGPPREGIRLLAIDAPPRRMMLATPALLAGSVAPWLARAGYHHIAAAQFDIALDEGFILDGEHFPGGALTVRQGPALAFVTP